MSAPGEAGREVPTAESLEFHALLVRLASVVGELGFRNCEIETILCLPPGSWPLTIDRQWAWQPERWQEARVRNLAEVCTGLERRFGAAATAWLRVRGPGMDGTPAAFLVSSDAALMALRDVLRLDGGGR